MTRLLGALLVPVVLLGSVLPRAGAQPSFAEALAGRVVIEAMLVHLRRLQEIADANGGNRADGTPGFNASADYVAQVLRDAGFEVTTPRITRLDTIAAGEPTLTVAGARYPVDQASLLVQTPVGGLSAPVIRPATPDGCVAADYPLGAAGLIAVAADTGCSVVDKQNAARGAAALIVVSDPGATGVRTGLFSPGYYDQLTIPVAVVGPDGGAALVGADGPVNLVLDSVNIEVTSQNVLAQTRTGSARDVVLVGAHLDSVSNGPGINDNGSGVAAVLETARQLGPAPSVTNAVRFAFWGAEESGLGGSSDYVLGLAREELNDIALYLNFDIIGSPNPGYFTSTGAGQDDTPLGSDGVERLLADYLSRAGRQPAREAFGHDSDYRPFMYAGVPVGGFTTGARGVKSDEQAREWGPRAGEAFDPNYHSPRDTVANIDPGALAITGSGVAYAVGAYAESIAGLPPHARRDRIRQLP